jgi:hypothetical protein
MRMQYGIPQQNQREVKVVRMPNLQKTIQGDLMEIIGKKP